jgi:hypothetical protein
MRACQAGHMADDPQRGGIDHGDLVSMRHEHFLARRIEGQVFPIIGRAQRQGLRRGWGKWQAGQGESQHGPFHGVIPRFRA